MQSKHWRGTDVNHHLRVAADDCGVVFDVHPSFLSLHRNCVSLSRQKQITNDLEPMNHSVSSWLQKRNNLPFSTARISLLQSSCATDADLCECFTLIVCTYQSRRECNFSM